MKNWIHDAFFYHIYPLGALNCPKHNDFTSPAVPRLDSLLSWIDHLKKLEINSLYLGPVFESSSHGYDTSDFYTVDRRLGNNETLKRVIEIMHQHEIKVILDGVFHHVGRNFWAFVDVLANRQNSEFKDWFSGLDFDRKSPFGDPFAYEGWNGHFDLVKLNLKNERLLEHILGAVEMWINDFAIDGLRLDVADKLPQFFMKRLTTFCKGHRPDFWLMGEVVHGDYRNWVAPDMLDSVTNYECYKGLYSSHADKNYFEIAWSLNRQFGSDGIYKDMRLYNFVDNHDVNRVRENLNKTSHLFPLHCLLFTMPGVPSIYYGSEFAISGRKNDSDDWNLRPPFDFEQYRSNQLANDLTREIARLAKIRLTSDALKNGSYQQIHVAHEQLAFIRQTDHEKVIVVVNSAEQEVEIPLKVPFLNNGNYNDILNHSYLEANNGILKCPVSSCCGRIIRI